MLLSFLFLQHEVVLNLLVVVRIIFVIDQLSEQLVTIPYFVFVNCVLFNNFHILFISDCCLLALFILSVRVRSVGAPELVVVIDEPID